MEYTLIAFIALALANLLLLLKIIVVEKKLNTLIKLLASYPRVVERLSKRIEAKKKVRKRYIVFEVISECKLTPKELSREIDSKVMELLGRIGIAQVGYRFLFFDEKLNIGIVRSTNKAYKLIIGVLGLVRKVGNCHVLIIPVSVHSTLNKAYEKIRELEQTK